MNESILIEEMKDTDWEYVKSIFQEGIDTGNATFQTETPTWEEWDKGHTEACRFVARLADEIIGWVALSPISSREAFRGVAEVSIYLSKNAAGKGIGSKLLSHLIQESEKSGFWTIQSMIFPENIGSIKLHHKHGFQETGTHQRMGKLNGVWRDVVRLEYRSEAVGID